MNKPSGGRPAKKTSRCPGPAARCQTIYTLNALTLLAALDDPRYAGVLSRADMIVADGIGAQWALWFLTGRKPERVPGIDLLVDLVRICSAEGQRVYFLGGRPGVARQCARKLAEKFPGLIIAGARAGFWQPGQEPDVVRQINRAHADLLLVGLGQPAQEIFLDCHRAGLHARVALGVGGSFDVLAGDLQRAPRWMRRAGLEWLFRTWQEPWRWRKLIQLPRLVWALGRMPKIKKTRD